MLCRWDLGGQVNETHHISSVKFFCFPFVNIYKIKNKKIIQDSSRSLNKNKA